MSPQIAPLNALNTEGLAHRWGMSRSTLENWRSSGKGPKYMKIGRTVLYSMEDITNYEQGARRQSTAANAP